jgi:hypothetical protein
VIGFTDILNREVSAGITDEEQAILAQVAPVLAEILDIGRVPDFWAETRAEQIAFLRFIDGLGALDVLPIGAPDGVPDLAPDQPRMYLGISEGANNGPGILPYARRSRPAALVAGGGAAVGGAAPPGRRFVLTALGSLYPSMTPSDIWIGVTMFQHLYDRQDAHNHAPFLYRHPVALPGNPPQRARCCGRWGSTTRCAQPRHHSLALVARAAPHLRRLQRAGAVPRRRRRAAAGQPRRRSPPAPSTSTCRSAWTAFDPNAGLRVTARTSREGHYCAQSAAEVVLPARDVLHVGAHRRADIIDPLADGAASGRRRGCSVEELRVR